jgi:hypothetical protein
MAVMVDPLAPYPRRPMGRDEWCHLATDTDFEELHQFAERLGLPRKAFQGDHYDLDRPMRQAAVALGAELVSTRQMVLRMVRSPRRRWKNRP